MEGRLTRYALVATLVALHAFCGIPEGFRQWGLLARAASYSLFHANWWHVAVNCLGIWTVFAGPRKCTPLHLAAAYAIATAVYPLALRPVIGASNFLYALIGIRTPVFSDPWWKRGTTIVFLLSTLAMVFIPRIAGLTHIYSFAAGAFLAGTGRIFDELTRDTRRYL